MDRNMNDHDMFVEALMILAAELEPEEDLIDPKLLYPAFAVSMIVNLLMGGHILSQVRDNVTCCIIFVTIFC